MKRIFRRPMKTEQVHSIRSGIEAAKADMEFALEYGYPPGRITPWEDTLFRKAYDRTLTNAVIRAFRRLARKVEETTKHFGLEKQ